MYPTADGWFLGTGGRQENVTELLSHPTFISRAGFQHLGKQRNKQKGTCKQKADVTLPRSPWDLWAAAQRVEGKGFLFASSAFPPLFSSSDSDVQFVFIGPWHKNGAHGFVFVLFRNSYTHQPLRIGFPFLREKVKGLQLCS